MLAKDWHINHLDCLVFEQRKIYRRNAFFAALILREKLGRDVANHIATLLWKMVKINFCSLICVPSNPFPDTLLSSKVFCIIHIRRLLAFRIRHKCEIGFLALSQENVL